MLQETIYLLQYILNRFLKYYETLQIDSTHQFLIL